MLGWSFPGPLLGGSGRVSCDTFTTGTCRDASYSFAQCYFINNLLRAAALDVFCDLWFVICPLCCAVLLLALFCCLACSVFASESCSGPGAVPWSLALLFL